ncbi:DUF1570 domain-containing protein [Erythrobacter sp. F6033]|uniref:DUF1570 domain-containing protein n=1 Tax=Erythrobacter sp. F6033 TaxID=2926401 RepID=UPI001FF1F68A|nr:DUF1570 domain-containing protein [Erythrobacter sp. F6033]MCK0128937.1 DUF1570 domain-containing protein [Erythrobacter sp. F6033]
MISIRYAGFITFIIGCLFFAQPAFAEWHKAESDRFVIYSDSRAGDLKQFAEMLERYHVAMELESGRKVPVPSPSNRLTVYMVGSRDNLRDVYGNPNSSVAGFYIPRANGSVTFVPNIKIRARDTSRQGTGSRFSRGSSGGALDRSFSILLHEYAHHFLISSARHAMPRWLSEGGAEYFSSARFNDDGSVDIGLPNNERAYEISQAAPVPVQELLDYELYRENRGNRYDAFYGRSWLLFHYLRFNPERSGQLVRYWQAVASGADSMEAADAIFGDLKRLESELKDYGRQRSMAGMRFSGNDISIGAVTVSEISDGHAKMMDVIIRSKRGVSDEKAQEVVAKAREVAAAFPADAAVQEALSEAEYDAGNDDAAIAAAKRAIKADPSLTNAYVQQGYALFRKAKDAEDQKAAYSAAMKPFEALNAIEADHTQPLIYYYRSFAQRGIEPPESAKFALERATQLAPFDKALAVDAAAMKAAEGDPDIARYLLAPVAANPHGGKQASMARALMDYLADIEQGTPVNIGAVRQQIEETGNGGDSDGEEAS